MKIWKLKFELDRFDNLIPCKEFRFDELKQFDGRPLKSQWKPLRVKRMEPRKKLPLGDAPGFTIISFSEKSLNTLAPLISDSVEVLDLVFSEAKYYAINVIKILDVIDYEKSEFIRYSDGGRIMCFKKYAFVNCKELESCHIFKIKDELHGKAFVSDTFKETVESAGLEGFVFEPVWDSESDSDVKEAAVCPTESNYYIDVQEVSSDLAADIELQIKSVSRYYKLQNCKSGHEIAEKICKVVDEYIKKHKRPRVFRDEIDFAVGLGCLYGHAICMEYGWKWKTFLGKDNRVAQGVVSPQGYYSCEPLTLINRILTGNNIGTDGKNDNTVMLLFNMLKDVERTKPDQMFSPLE